MKKRMTLLAALLSLGMITGSFTPAMADATKVVTLGADLSQDEQNTILKYFNVDRNQVHVVSVNNQEERALLGQSIPLAQIGSYTLSCAYVKPTSSGGIKVRTANLNYVTCSMIASVLSTAGVTNCEVVAACPIEVSGTGALAGIVKAYETATGQALPENKKKLATEELAVSSNVSNSVGRKGARTIIDQSKLTVINNNVTNVEEITNIVNNVSYEYNIDLDVELTQQIVNLLVQMSEEDYDAGQMAESLSPSYSEEPADQNPTIEFIPDTVDETDTTADTVSDTAADTVSDTTGDTVEDGSEELTVTTDDVQQQADAAEEDNILDQVDPDAFGSDTLIETSTEDQSLQKDTQGEDADTTPGDQLAGVDAPQYEIQDVSPEEAAEQAGLTDLAGGSDDGWETFNTDGTPSDTAADGTSDTTAADVSAESTPADGGQSADASQNTEDLTNTDTTGLDDTGLGSDEGWTTFNSDGTSQDSGNVMEDDGEPEETTVDDNASDSSMTPVDESALPQDDADEMDTGADANAETNTEMDTDINTDINTDTQETDSADISESTTDSGSDTEALQALVATLDAEDKADYDKARDFCDGYYMNDDAKLSSAMPSMSTRSVSLDPQTGASLENAVLKAYADVLSKGTTSATGTYMSPTLNAVDNSMKSVFGINGQTDASLSALNPDEQQKLYSDTMKFFEELYGEASSAQTDDQAAADEYTDEYADQYADGYTDEYTDEYTDGYTDEYTDTYTDEYGDAYGYDEESQAW